MVVKDHSLSTTTWSFALSRHLEQLILEHRDITSVDTCRHGKDSLRYRVDVTTYSNTVNTINIIREFFCFYSLLFSYNLTPISPYYRHDGITQ